MQCAKRRMAVTVAADIADYALRIGQNEEGTLCAVRARRREFIDRVIEEHGAWRRPEADHRLQCRGAKDYHVQANALSGRTATPGPMR